MSQYLMKSEKTGRVALKVRCRWFQHDDVLLMFEMINTWEDSQTFDTSTTISWRRATQVELVDLAYAGAKKLGPEDTANLSYDPEKSESNHVRTGRRH